ncbi:ABC transporter ATP-binding protein [Tropicibacter sp. S64]|uniref:ABC transporter ATP-binding protein n=1 Tax=Tropicibacter sp. S64 TaxID=3415122 RepID=UPI003C7A6879
MADVQLRGLGKSFGALQVIRGIDLDIAHGELVVFVGPSGCGKSTLLRMIAGLEAITQGTLLIGGDVCNGLEPRDRGIAMVFQSYALYPHMSVYDNVGFSLKLARVPQAERDAKIREVAQILHMEHLLDRRPAQLSGGQRQRVAIGRAIVRHPKVFLFDEPLSNLDASLRVEMRMEIARLHNELGATMIYVTHDQVEAMTLADRIVVMNQGSVQQVGTPLDLYRKPANMFVAGFIGSPRMNFIQAEITVGATGQVFLSSQDLLPTPIKASAGELARKVVLGIRPQQLHTNPTGAPVLSTTVDLIERLGDRTIVNLRLQSGQKLLAELDGGASIALGQRLDVHFDPEQTNLFDIEGTRIWPR